MKSKKEQRLKEFQAKPFKELHEIKEIERKNEKKINNSNHSSASHPLKNIIILFQIT